jgi:hypothetical protein
MSLTVEFGIAASGPASGHYLNLWMCLNIWVHFYGGTLETPQKTGLSTPISQYHTS